VPLSDPPTPGLTYSPTPPATALPSPKRASSAMGAHRTEHSTTDVDADIDILHAASPRGRRRKHRAEWDEDKMRSMESEERGASPGDAWSVLPGCGRVLCRNCCVENMQRCDFGLRGLHRANIDECVLSDTTTCLDCYGCK
jgi:hypothetical protein